MTDDLRCVRCGRTGRTQAVYAARCACGGLWEAADGAVYPAELGATHTPLWPDPEEPGLLWKREDLNATGSFKDRGAAVLVAVARAAGASALVADSSGSAALAAAGAAAQAEIPLTVHVPEGLPAAKRRALVTLGARVVESGARSDAAERARGEAERAFYFSHVHHPAFFEGTGRAAVEVLEDTGGRPPGTWLVPVGNGSLLLGLARVLRRQAPGSVRLVAVQARACPGLRAPGKASGTRAAGIAISDPARREEILARVEESGGEVLEIEEPEMEAAWERLARRGVIAERASAVAEAAARRLRERGETGSRLGWLTGSGLRE